tara:strand:+ start:96 stop:437 length:342 start_codon:yes stop_codon:yes gene_type:complete
MFRKIYKWFNIDRIVDLMVDLILLLFDVITSPVLIVMRLLRWLLANYFLDGIKNKIKKLIYWLKTKPWWVSMIVVPIAVIVLFYVFVFLWLAGELFNPELWREEDVSNINSKK